MTNTIYRGVAYDADRKSAEVYPQRAARPDLTYRGVRHDGEVAVRIGRVHTRAEPLFYRGFRVA